MVANVQRNLRHIQAICGLTFSYVMLSFETRDLKIIHNRSEICTKTVSTGVQTALI